MSDRARMTFDELLSEMEKIARDGEGADKFRAVKALMSQESTSSALPAPMTDAEVIDRLSRLIRAAGPTAAQIAYRQAFPKARKTLEQAAPRLLESDLPPVDALHLPTTLRALYRMFPEIKGPGVPKGYPINRGMIEKKMWVQREAKRMLLDKEQRRLISPVEGEASATQ